jgi:hypothetical protein
MGMLVMITDFIIARLLVRNVAVLGFQNSDRYCRRVCNFLEIIYLAA